MVRTIIQKTKGKAKERAKDEQPIRTKKGRELVPRASPPWSGGPLISLASLGIGFKADFLLI